MTVPEIIKMRTYAYSQDVKHYFIQMMVSEQ